MSTHPAIPPKHISPHLGGPQATSGADCHRLSHTVEGVDHLYRGDQCDDTVHSMGGEDLGGVTRNTKRMRTSSVFSDQEGRFWGGGGGGGGGLCVDLHITSDTPITQHGYHRTRYPHHTTMATHHTIYPYIISTQPWLHTTMVWVVRGCVVAFLKILGIIRVGQCVFMHDTPGLRELN